MEKQVESRKKAFMDGVIFLSGMRKQKMSLTTSFLGGLSLPKKSYFNRFKSFITMVRTVTHLQTFIMCKQNPKLEKQ